MKHIIVTAITMILLTSCAVVTSPKAPSFAAAPTPEPAADKSILYIYRHYSQPTAYVGSLQIDKQEIISLNQEGFTWIYVTPGTRKFKFGFPPITGMPTVDFEHTFEPGKIYAFEMQGISAGPRIVSAIQPTDINEAKQKLLTCCRYVAPKKTNF